jgi:16S rRNA (cytosine1402-N4)-methyltransferase
LSETSNIPHIPVLLTQTIDSLKHIDNGYIVDCTLGYGGHSQALLEQNSNIKLICNDQDDDALEFSQNRLSSYSSRVNFIKGRFSQILDNDFTQNSISNIRGILADIGISSLHVDKKERGFSFLSQTLDMRMNQQSTFSAEDVVNSYSLSQLEDIFNKYGEIREYKKMANLIYQNRPFNSSQSLADFIKKNFKSGGKIHPATLAFQAIRIEVNDELGELNGLLDSIEKYARLDDENRLQDCTISIISFHSLEDKIVKERFKRWAMKCICPKELMRCECSKNNQLGKIITKKPIIASKDEIKSNPRSRSAKLRVFQICTL